MIEVHFFARIREQLDCKRLSLDAGCGNNVRDLRHYLIARHGPLWQEVLARDNVIVARNKQVCDLDESIADGDEVAFYPPVTGG